MDPHQIVGVALLCAGFLDPLIGWFVVRPRVADPRARGVVVASLFLGGAVMMVFGGLFLARVIPLG
jgi:hypothetical protein